MKFNAAVSIPYPKSDNLDRRTLLKFNEPSFNDYKGLVKQLTTFSDKGLPEHDRTGIFEIFFENRFPDKIGLHVSDGLNCLQIFYFLVYLRGHILGNNFSFTSEGKSYEYSLDLLLKDIESALQKKATFQDAELSHLHISNGFWTGDFEYQVAGALDINVGELNDIVDVSVVQILSQINRFGEQFSISFPSKDNCIAKLNYLEPSTLNTFLYALYYTDLKSLYDFESACIQQLQLKGKDLDHYSYPELKILLNNHREAMNQNNSKNEQHRQSIN